MSIMLKSLALGSKEQNTCGAFLFYFGGIEKRSAITVLSTTTPSWSEAIDVPDNNIQAIDVFKGNRTWAS